jgi:hypothetical protein
MVKKTEAPDKLADESGQENEDGDVEDDEFESEERTVSFITIKRWVKFLRIIQKEDANDINKEEIQRLIDRYPREGHSHDKILKWFKNSGMKDDDPPQEEIEALKHLKEYFILSKFDPDYHHTKKLRVKRTIAGRGERETPVITRRMFFDHLFDHEENGIFDNKSLALDSSTYYGKNMFDYWIDSSHNTYLTGNQLNSVSSTEQYRMALMRGCRCLELDVWDYGALASPMVLHGHTLTKPVSFADCIAAIRKYAFHTSKGPIILSLEVHCNAKGKKKMSYILHNILNPKKPTPKSPNYWIDPLVAHNKQYMFSPWNLQNKILIKAGSSKDTSMNDEMDEEKQEELIKSLEKGNLQERIMANRIKKQNAEEKKI